MHEAKTKARYKKSKALKQFEDAVFEKKKHNTSFPYPVKPRFRDDTTNGLTICVLELIRYRGGHAERVNSTGILVKDKNGTEKMVKGSSYRGTADVHAVYNQRALKVEVKCKSTKDHYQSKYQKEYQKSVEAAGGKYLIARTFDGFAAEFTKWRNEQKKNN